MSESERLKAVMETAGMNAKQFAMEVGISAGTLSNIMKGRNRPSLDVMQAVLNRFRQVRSDWLILGSGSMSYGVADGVRPVAEDVNEAAEEPVLQPVAPQEARPRFRELSLFGEDEVPVVSVPAAGASASQESLRGRDESAFASGHRGVREENALAAEPRVRQQRRQPQGGGVQPQSRRLVRILLMYDDGTFEER